jgi:hypothetical protein
MSVYGGQKQSENQVLLAFVQPISLITCSDRWICRSIQFPIGISLNSIILAGIYSNIDRKNKELFSQK